MAREFPGNEASPPTSIGLGSKSDDSGPLPRPLGLALMSDDPWADSNTVSLSQSPGRALSHSPTSELRTPTSLTPQLSGADLGDVGDEEDVLADESLTPTSKSKALQRILFVAASNGDVDRVHSLLGGQGRDFVDVDAKDDSGSTALIYSSCFGHEHVVSELLRYGANPDEQDNNEWTALMWAINNNHGAIVARLMENNASLDVRTATGRSALDFVTPNSEIYNYMREHGFMTDSKGDPQDFYDDGKIAGVSEDEINNRIMMETAAYNFNFDMASLTIEPAQFESELAEEEEQAEEQEGAQPFVWERCLPDQMFVFNAADIPKILDESITNMIPARSRSQKPIPANMIFLSARYANTVGDSGMLQSLLDPVLFRIRDVVTKHKDDIAFLSFWMANTSLLLYYIRRDNNLFPATAKFQESLSELVTDIYLLITQDAERRIDKVLDEAILDHDTIPGMENIHYQREWRLFRHKEKHLTKKEEVDQTIRPPSPTRKAKPAPRTVTSILSSVLFMMDLFDVHPNITQQIISQILYWLGTTLFNRVMSNRKYLARSRAMQIRLNVSNIEDWARANSRRPVDPDEEFDNKPMKNKTISELCEMHFEPLVQILQWLQIFTGFGDDFTNVVAALQQLKALNPLQLLHVANKYRPEVGEKGLSKEYKKYLTHLAAHYKNRFTHSATVDLPKDKSKEDTDKGEKDNKESVKDAGQEQKDGGNGSGNGKEPEKVPEKEDQGKDRPADQKSADKPPSEKESSPVQPTIVKQDDDEDVPELLLDASMVLPFVIPTLREMIMTWGAGLGGTNKRRARKYEPSLPTEFLDKFETDEDYTSGHNDPGTSMFSSLAVPEPSAHKQWGDDKWGDEDVDLNSVW
uniref:ARAD1C03256p n=1 Tax=Blastobotrys adeninivorans TaxID=409370 RepID=A0A060T561_BLAAD